MKDRRVLHFAQGTGFRTPESVASLMRRVADTIDAEGVEDVIDITFTPEWPDSTKSWLAHDVAHFTVYYANKSKKKKKAS